MNKIAAIILRGILLFAEIATQPQVAARGSGMQRCPHLSVASIDVGTSLHQQAHDVQSIVDAALLTAHVTINFPNTRLSPQAVLALQFWEFKSSRLSSFLLSLPFSFYQASVPFPMLHSSPLSSPSP